jgi:hypothetical protein
VVLKTTTTFYHNFCGSLQDYWNRMLPIDIGRLISALAISFFLGCSIPGLFSYDITGMDDPPSTSQYFDPPTAPQQTVPSPEASKVVDITNVQEAVTVCTPITPEQTAALKSGIDDYEKSKRFRIKIQEVKGGGKVEAHHVAIEKYLREKVLEPGWSVLELGCAAGMMLQMVKRAYEKAGSEHKELVGVELVTGWVNFAQSYYTDIKVFEGENACIRSVDQYRY